MPADTERDPSGKPIRTAAVAASEGYAPIRRPSVAAYPQVVHAHRAGGAGGRSAARRGPSRKREELLRTEGEPASPSRSPPGIETATRWRTHRAARSRRGRGSL
jgi:hypothetical protein